MYKVFASNEKVSYEVLELAKMFLPVEEIELVIQPSDLDKNQQKRDVYDFLSKALKKTLDWGILTGVRPTKLYSSLVKEYGIEKANGILKDEYYLSDSKIDLLQRTYITQDKMNYDKSKKAIGLYVGIPFCPTRCLYCSFTSNKITKDAASKYLVALEKEIKATERIFKEKDKYVESIYIGGGTPTSLDEEDFEKMLSMVTKAFKTDKLLEFTVECGRPDTITKEKLLLIKKYGADRISINPQTMKEETLMLIGRNHTPKEIVDAYTLARETGDFIINMDLITGLPEETIEDFVDTLNTVVDLNPENITVHTLAVKRASRLIDEDKDYAFKQAEVVRGMLKEGSSILSKAGYNPYYLYRQKHMAGNFENVGYCRDDKSSVYNVRIMEEDQSIIALGAGGISKMYYPDENRIERIPNVSNYEIYIERIDEMIQRKEIGIDD